MAHGYTIMMFRIQYRHHKRDWITAFERNESAALALSRSLAKDSTVDCITVSCALIDIPSTVDWRAI